MPWIVRANRSVRYNRMLRSAAEAAAPVRFRMWVDDVRDQLKMTYNESSKPPKASSHHTPR